MVNSSRKVISFCFQCGKKIEAYKHKDNIRKFCSRFCSSQFPRDDETNFKKGSSFRGKSKNDRGEKWAAAVSKERPTTKGRKPPNYNPDRHQQSLKKKFYYIHLGVLHRVIDAREIKKISKSEKMLGYSYEDLRKHLESLWQPGMSWENYGKKSDQWSIDHVRPVSSWPIDAKVSEINALSNLRPLWHIENLKKGSKWSEKP